MSCSRFFFFPFDNFFFSKPQVTHLFWRPVLAGDKNGRSLFHLEFESVSHGFSALENMIAVQ